jgi:hypothetical protein
VLLYLHRFESAALVLLYLHRVRARAGAMVARFEYGPRVVVCIGSRLRLGVGLLSLFFPWFTLIAWYIGFCDP